MAIQSPSEGKRYLRKYRLVHTRISLRSIRATLARSRTRIAIGTATRKPSFQNQFTLLAYVYAYGVCSMAATDQVREHRRRAQECVDIATKAALGKMVLPGLLVVGMTVGVGVVFRLIYYAGGQPATGASGAEVIGGFLMVGTITGILMALFLNNGGGAWDNAKKYIETGALGGKKSEPHKAAVVGDTVGDPFKDTAGPSLHVLIKLLSTITLVLAPLFI